MIKIIIIIFVIIVIIRIILNINSIYYKIYNNYIKKIEGERNKAMNGISNSKYYILFSHHFHLFKLLQKLISEFNKSNIKVFISNGLLIGYHRHNNSFIPWDDDIDVGCFLEDRSKIIDILKNIHKDDNRFNYVYNNYAGLDKFIYNNNDFDLIQIDIFYYKYYEDKGYYHYHTQFLMFQFPREYYFKNEIEKLDQGQIKLYMPDGSLYETIINVPIPTNSVDFLNRAYPGWENTYIIARPHNIFYNVFINKLIYPIKIKKIDK